MVQFWSVLLHLHVPALFIHPFQKPFVWDFFSRWRAYTNCVITVAQISEWSVYFCYMQVLHLRT